MVEEITALRGPRGDGPLRSQKSDFKPAFSRVRRSINKSKSARWLITRNYSDLMDVVKKEKAGDEIEKELFSYRGEIDFNNAFSRLILIDHHICLKIYHECKKGKSKETF